MTPRSQSAISARERRTQGVRIAALFARLRTYYPAAQRALAAGASFLSSLLGKNAQLRSTLDSLETTVCTELLVDAGEMVAYCAL